MAQLNRVPDEQNFHSRPSDDFIVIDAEADSVMVEINEWCTKTRQHFSVKLKLHHSEARLLADMLARNAEEACNA